MTDPKDATIQQLRAQLYETQVERDRLRKVIEDWDSQAEIQQLREALTSVSYRAELSRAERDVALEALAAMTQERDQLKRDTRNLFLPDIGTSEKGQG